MKIYISSTYQDLAAHRKAIAATLRRMGHQVVGEVRRFERSERPVDERTPMEQIARLFVREQVSRALSTVR